MQNTSCGMLQPYAREEPVPMNADALATEINALLRPMTDRRYRIPMARSARPIFIGRGSRVYRL